MSDAFGELSHCEALKITIGVLRAPVPRLALPDDRRRGTAGNWPFRALRAAEALVVTLQKQTPVLCAGL